MQHRQTPVQPDLFSTPTPAPGLPNDMRQRILLLIAVLLREAVRGIREADHEDHA